jgi:hypothetical protein
MNDLLLPKIPARQNFSDLQGFFCFTAARLRIFQRYLFHKFGHVLEGVATILQGFIDFAEDDDADGINIALIKRAHRLDIQQIPFLLTGIDPVNDFMDLFLRFLVGFQ